MKAGIALLILISQHCSSFVVHSLTKRPYITAFSFATDNTKDYVHLPTIQIFDNVFSSFACEEISYLAEDHSSRGNDGSSIFTRPPHNDKPLTPIEHAIDSFLVAIGDTTKKVEYWSRDEYINIDTHADIDEEQLLNENTIRCPKVAHVLYLQVEDELRGPTCVFPTKQNGWNTQDGGDIGDDVELIVVPAVNGRVLRFPGNAMHSVPCPANRWLLNSEEEQLINEKDSDTDGLDSLYEEEDDSDYDDDFRQRSVLLFNTWPDEEPGPRGVNGDYMNGSLPEGIELSDEDSLSFLHTEEARMLAEWEEEYGSNAEEIRCNRPDCWREVQITNISKDMNDEMMMGIKVGLMGNKNRRLYENKFALLFGPKNALELALNHERLPSSIQLCNKQ